MDLNIHIYQQGPRLLYHQRQTPRRPMELKRLILDICVLLGKSTMAEDISDRDTFELIIDNPLLRVCLLALARPTE